MHIQLVHFPPQSWKQGDNATFSVQPVSGLSQGEYLEDIVIANDANVEAYVNVHFSVTKKKQITVRRRITLQVSKSHPISKIFPMEPRKPRKP